MARAARAAREGIAQETMPDARESIVDADGELGSTPVVPEKDAQSRDGTAQGATADGGAANAMPDAVPVRYFNF